jgi:hypothetical protein
MWARIAALCLVATLAVPAAGAEPDAASTQRAAEQYDAGDASYRAQNFEAAASHFEAAYAASPSALVLRRAIRSRDAAGQGARAATLAALAKRRFPKHDETVQFAEEIIAKYQAELGRVEVTCATPCVVAVGKRALLGGNAREHVVYATPGEVKLRASFKAGGDAEQLVTATAGQTTAVAIEPAAVETAAPPVTPDLPPPPPVDPTVLPGPDPAKFETPPPNANPEPPFEIVTSRPAPSRPWYKSPALFGASLGVTAVLGGVTIWSGVDTLRNPGKEAVRAACAGKGTDCPEYREGVGKQIRTNALIGATAGMGLVTVLIGALLTDFKGRRTVDMSWTITPHEGRVELVTAF